MPKISKLLPFVLLFASIGVSLLLALGFLEYYRRRVEGRETIEGKLRARANSSMEITNFEYPSFTAHFNSLGFRDDEFVLKKPPGTSRVLLIGDSFVWGTSTARDSNIDKLVEAKLAKVAHVEVFSLGVGGAGLPDYLDFAKKFVDYKPDAVILSFYVDNDVESLPEDWDPADIAELDSPSDGVGPTRFMRWRSLAFLKDSYFRYVLGCPGQEPWVILYKKRGLDSKYIDYACHDLMNAWYFHRGSYGDNHQYYELLAKVQKSNPLTFNYLREIHGVYPGIPFLLLINPSKYQVSSRYFPELRKVGFEFSKDGPVSAEIQDGLLHFAEEEKISAVDMLPFFKARPDLQYYNVIDDHYTVLGNQAVADALANWIENKVLLKPSDNPGIPRISEPAREQ